MALIQSLWAKGALPVARPQTAWTVHAQTFIMELPAAGVQPEDIIELAVLPPYARIVGAKLFKVGEMGDGNAVSIGLMSGTTGELTNDDDSARTSGAELFAATPLTEEITYLSKAEALLIEPTDHDRSIGVRFSTAITVGTGKQIALLLHFTQ